MEHKLNQILDTISRLPTVTVTPPSVVPDTLSNPEPKPRKARQPKLVTLPEFDRDCKKDLTFLNSCQTYIRLCPEEFHDEQMKIIWAMSYMKSGRAAKWTARIFKWEELSENEGCLKFADWEDFRDEFKRSSPQRTQTR